MKLNSILEDITKQDIAKLLDRDNISFQSDFARIKAALWIYKFQTEDEQELGQTIHKNFVGFMGHGSLKISTVCKKLLEHKELTPNEIILVRDSITKYAGQLAKLINKGLIQKGDNDIEQAIETWSDKHKKYYIIRNEQEQYLHDIIKKYFEIEKLNEKYLIVNMDSFRHTIRVYGWHIWDSDLLNKLWNKYKPMISLNPYKSGNRFDDPHLQTLKNNINDNVLSLANNYKNIVNEEFKLLKRLTAMLLPGEMSYTERYEKLVKNFKYIDGTPYKIEVTFTDGSILTYFKSENITFNVSYLGTETWFDIFHLDEMTDDKLKGIAKDIKSIRDLLNSRFSSTLEQFIKIVNYLLWVYQNKQKWYMKYKKEEMMDLYHQMNGNDKLTAKEYYLSKAPNEYKKELDF